MDYRATLNLPETNFKMKAGLAQREPEFLRQWDQEQLYAAVMAAGEGRPRYILHDGPPYANGHIHLGTAFNKVLKDIILKSKRMAGFHCPYVPGWDCHGLPIEHNVDQELGAKKREIPVLSFRAACRKYAEKWIKTQKAEFKRLGVLGDWDHPYLTIQNEYEAAIAREFNRFLLNGSVIRSKKPVYWCSSCGTALAEAEVEYHDHTSSSIYVKFPVREDFSDVAPELAGKKVRVERNYEKGLPPVAADHEQLSQAFLNLLLNALDAVEEDGEIIIGLRRRLDRSALDITIADNGRGIPPENLEKVFEPFFSTKPKGTGLGLAIAYRIVENHGGEITVNNRQGGGTIFSITLPLHDPGNNRG